MGELEEHLRQWKDMVYFHDIDFASVPPVRDFIYEVWKPKVSFFRPPMNKWFRWAYDIDRKLFKGVYLLSFGMDINSGD